MTKQKRNQKQTGSEVKTFSIPFNPVEIKENITITTQKPSKSSKEQIISQAFKFHSQGNLQEAAKYYQYYINQGFANHKVFSNYGIILQDLGKTQEAENSYRKAIELKPDYAEAHLNLGHILIDLGNLQEAELYTRNAIKINPNFAEAIYNLGNIYKVLGKLEEAELSTRKAIELKPDFANAHLNLGVILKELDKLKEAEISNRKAIELNPDFAEAYSNLGQILKDLGKSKEEKVCYESLIKLKPNDLSANIQTKLIISPIPFSQEQILLERNEINKNISIIGSQEKIILNKYPKSIHFIFYLPYHNCNDDKKILINIANNLSKKNGIVCKSFNKDKQINHNKERGKIRLGIISEFLYNHSIGKAYKNLIKDFADAGLEIIIFKTANNKSDKTSKDIDFTVSEIIHLPTSLQSAGNIIINKSVDVLFYLDIGMSPFTYLLSLSRLALVQVTAGGHPNTSGSPNIDYFISSKYIETETSDKYYSERLIRLSKINVNYSIPHIPECTFDRENLNLPNNSFLIGLPHTLFKIHPNFDQILDKILKEIPNSFLLLFEGHGAEAEQLKSRWRKNTNLLINRAIFHKRVKLDNFLKILKNMDIVLDPFYISMGNTFYQSMALGIPIVTMPMNQARSRIVYAGYKQMDIKNPPVAYSPEEYISICKRLAFDKSYKDDIVSQILTKSKEKLFNNKTIHKEYIEFFKKSIDSARNNQRLPLKWTPKSNI